MSCALSGLIFQGKPAVLSNLHHTLKMPNIYLKITLKKTHYFQSVYFNCTDQNLSQEKSSRTPSLLLGTSYFIAPKNPHTQLSSYMVMVRGGGVRSKVQISISHGCYITLGEHCGIVVNKRRQSIAFYCYHTINAVHEKFTSQSYCNSSHVLTHLLFCTLQNLRFCFVYMRYHSLASVNIHMEEAHFKLKKV